MEVKEPPHKLSNLPDEQLLEIKEILAVYFAEKATEEMDRLWDENGRSNEIIQQWLASPRPVSGIPNL